MFSEFLLLLLIRNKFTFIYFFKRIFHRNKTERPRKNRIRKQSSLRSFNLDMNTDINITPCKVSPFFAPSYLCLLCAFAIRLTASLFLVGCFSPIFMLVMASIWSFQSFSAYFYGKLLLLLFSLSSFAKSFVSDANAAAVC